jgi:membrane protein DedA with SNARE-associated domain
MENLSTFFGNFLATYGLLAIFIIMLLKECGIPVPVPSDLIMITAGVQAATGAYGLLELALALGLATLIGGSLQFFISRKAGRAVIYKLGRFIGLTPQRLDKAMAVLQKRGPFAIFLGLNLPGARAGIIPAAGLAGFGYPSFAPAMLSGSGLFYGWHIALGYLVGPSATALLENLNLPLGPILVGLAVLGLLGWLILRWRAKRTGTPAAPLEQLHQWTHAACPACLTITAIQQLNQERAPAILNAETR